MGYVPIFIGIFATIVGHARGEMLFPIVGAAYLFEGLFAVIALRNRCHSCHRTNDDEAIDCRHCGRKLCGTLGKERLELFIQDFNKRVVSTRKIIKTYKAWEGPAVGHIPGWNRRA